MRTGLTAVSKETAVPLPTIEEQQRNHPNVGLGDLFLAQELAVQTQQSVDQVLKQHSGGRTWNEIASSKVNSVPNTASSRRFTRRTRRRAFR